MTLSSYKKRINKKRINKKIKKRTINKKIECKNRRTRKNGGLSKNGILSSSIKDKSKSPIIEADIDIDIDIDKLPSTYHNIINTMDENESNLFEVYQNNEVFKNKELIELMIDTDMNERIERHIPKMNSILLSLKAFYLNMMDENESTTFIKTLCEKAILESSNNTYVTKIFYNIIGTYVNGASYTLNHYLYQKVHISLWIDENTTTQLLSIYNLFINIIQDYCMLLSTSPEQYELFNNSDSSSLQYTEELLKYTDVYEAIINIFKEKDTKLIEILDNNYLLEIFLKAMNQVFKVDNIFVTINKTEKILYRGINKPYTPEFISQLMGPSPAFISASSDKTIAALHSIGSYIKNFDTIEPGFIIRMIVEPGIKHINVEDYTNYYSLKIKKLSTSIINGLHFNQKEFIFPINTHFIFNKIQVKPYKWLLSKTNKKINDYFEENIRKLKRRHPTFLFDDVVVVDVSIKE